MAILCDAVVWAPAALPRSLVRLLAEGRREVPAREGLRQQPIDRLGNQRRQPLKVSLLLLCCPERCI